MLGLTVSWNQLQGAVPAALGTADTVWAFPTLMFSHTAACFFFGRLTDFVGRRWPFIACNVLAFVGFLASGRVPVTQPTAISGIVVLIGLGTSLQIQGPFFGSGRVGACQPAVRRCCPVVFAVGTALCHGPGHLYCFDTPHCRRLALGLLDQCHSVVCLGCRFVCVLPSSKDC